MGDTLSPVRISLPIELRVINALGKRCVRYTVQQQFLRETEKIGFETHLESTVVANRNFRFTFISYFC